MNKFHLYDKSGQFLSPILRMAMLLWVALFVTNALLPEYLATFGEEKMELAEKGETESEKEKEEKKEREKEKDEIASELLYYEVTYQQLNSGCTHDNEYWLSHVAEIITPPPEVA